MAFICFFVIGSESKKGGSLISVISNLKFSESRSKELEGITGTIWYNALILQEIEAQRNEIKYSGVRSCFFPPKDPKF